MEKNNYIENNFIEFLNWIIKYTSNTKEINKKIKYYDKLDEKNIKSLLCFSQYIRNIGYEQLVCFQILKTKMIFLYI